MRDQVMRDIDKWSDDKLRQWFTDSVSRYVIADMPMGRAIASTTMIMLTATVGMMVKEEMPVEDIVKTFEEVVREIRKQRASSHD